MKNKFIGQPCTSCRSVLREGEEIVVCPDCGSPYHKDCYKAEGKCVNASLHEKGGSWEPERLDPETAGDTAGSAAFSATDSENTVGIVCPVCSNTNPADAVFCSKCGTPLNMAKANRDPSGTFGVPFGGFRADANENVDGNSVSEYTRYVGSNFYYYLPRFMRFGKSGKKLSFNFSAFLFPNLYFFYRKMPVLGIIFFLLTELLSIPNVVLMMAEYELISSSILSNMTFITVNNVSVVLSYVLMFVGAFLANWFYYKKAKKDIKDIKQKYENPVERNNAINRAGGTSVLYLGLAFLLQMAVTAIAMFAIISMVS